MRAARAQGRANSRGGTGAERVHGEAEACDGAVEYCVVAASGNKLAVGDVLGELVVHPALHRFWLGVGGLGFEVWDLGIGVYGLGMRAEGSPAQGQPTACRSLQCKPCCLRRLGSPRSKGAAECLEELGWEHARGRSQRVWATLTRRVLNLQQEQWRRQQAQPHRCHFRPTCSAAAGRRERRKWSPVSPAGKSVTSDV